MASLTIDQYKQLLEVSENTIIKIFTARFDKLEDKVYQFKEENKDLKKEIDELKEALSFQNTQHEKAIKELKDEKEKVRDNGRGMEELREMKNENEYLTDRMTEFEDRNRRNNLRFDGIEDNEEEIWDESEDKVKSFIRRRIRG